MRQSNLERENQMKRWWKVLAVVGLAGALSGCATKAEHNQLRADHEALKAKTEEVVTQLNAWAVEMHAWADFTYRTMCDVVGSNPPFSKYGPPTQEYCGDTEPGGAPPKPPEFGAD